MKSLLWLILILPCATFVFAQEEPHADIRPYVLNGKIHTRGYIDGTSTELPDSRAFGFDFGEEADDPYFILDPGFNSSDKSGLTGGSQISFNVIDMASYGLSGNLTYWNGVGTVQFVAAPNNETLTLSRPTSTTPLTTTVGIATGTQVGFNFPSVSGTGVIHSHLNSFLATSSGLPPDGIYLLGIELLSSDSSILKSDPIFLVYNNGLTEAAHDEAIDWVQANLVVNAVPEPGVWVPAILVALLACLVYRRRRRLLPAERN